jgi:hypothetical protein
MLAGLGLLIAAIGCIPGCKRDVVQPDAPIAATTEKPTPANLVAYLNDNAHKVSSLKSTEVQIDAKQGSEEIGLTGSLFCQKPRDFRLRAKVAGQPAVDIGSNSDEFWFWISQAKDQDGVARVHYCSYQDMAAGKAHVPFPFQPDMIVAALGLGEYDATKEYTLKEDAKTVQLVESAKSPQGDDVYKLTVFNKTRVAPGKPQVLAYVLQDARGNDICRASIQDVQTITVGNERALVPQRVQLLWKQQQMEASMTMRLYYPEANSIDARQAAKLFNRSDLSIPAVNLAQSADAPGQDMSLRQTRLQAPMK